MEEALLYFIVLRRQARVKVLGKRGEATALGQSAANH